MGSKSEPWELCGESIPDRQQSRCKCLETGASLLFSSKQQEGQQSQGAEKVAGRVGDETGAGGQSRPEQVRMVFLGAHGDPCDPV